MTNRIIYEFLASDIRVLIAATMPNYAGMDGLSLSAQIKINNFWSSLGNKMGFDPMTAQMNPDNIRFFSATPCKTESEIKSLQEEEERLKKEISKINLGVMRARSILREITGD